MGQKAHPVGTRLGILSNWESEWFTTNKTTNSHLTVQTHELKNLLGAFLFIKGFLVHSLKLKYFNNTLFLKISLIPTYLKWLSLKKINLKNFYSLKLKKLQLKKNLIYNKKYKNFKLTKDSYFFNKFFFLLLKNFIKSKLLLLKKIYHKEVSFLLIKKLTESFLNLQNFSTCVLKVTDLSKCTKMSTPKRGRFFDPTFEWIYLFSLIKKQKPSALLIGNYVKYLLEKKGMKKRQRFVLNSLRRFLIQNQKILTNLKGLKIQVNGRINGRNRSTTYVIQLGCVPLQTFSKKIDYTFLPCFTLDGVFGIKVWVVPLNN